MKVKIYGTEDCRFCVAAKTLAEKLELDFEYIDAASDMQGFSKLFPSARTVPQIMIDDTHIGGYRDFEEVMETMCE